MLLAPAIAYLALDGFRARVCALGKDALAALWIVPLIARGVAQATLIPLRRHRHAGDVRAQSFAARVAISIPPLMAFPLPAR